MQSPEAAQLREAQLEVIESRSLCRELQGRLDRSLSEAETLRHRLLEQRRRAAERESELCAEVERLRRTVELERRRATIPVEWDDVQTLYKRDLAAATVAAQTSPFVDRDWRSPGRAKVDAIIDATDAAATTTTVKMKLGDGHGHSVRRSSSLDAAGGASVPVPTGFFEEVAVAAFDEYLAPVLSDVLQAIVLREVLRLKSAGADLGFFFFEGVRPSAGSAHDDRSSMQRGPFTSAGHGTTSSNADDVLRAFGPTHHRDIAAILGGRGAASTGRPRPPRFAPAAASKSTDLQFSPQTSAVFDSVEL